jgi:fermentation-respiration switch protein FrsA (DUF1100 family)
VRRTFRRLVIGVVTAAALGYAGIIAYLMLAETSLVYLPAERPVAAPSPEFALRERAVRFAASDGTRLSAWVIPAAQADSSGMWLLICHGNYGNIGYGQRPEFYAFARDIGLNLFAFDYRGFGESEGAPSERGVYDDAESAYRFLRDSLRVPAEQIVVFGHSLGSGVAIELASRVPAAALVVEGAYTSIPDVGQKAYPYIPVKLVARNRFASIDKVGRITIPKLFLHSPTDDVIPLAFGKRLFDAAPEPRQFIEVTGGHENAYRLDRDRYFGAIRELARSAGGHAGHVSSGGTRP